MENYDSTFRQSEMKSVLGEPSNDNYIVLTNAVDTPMHQLLDFNSLRMSTGGYSVYNNNNSVEYCSDFPDNKCAIEIQPNPYQNPAYTTLFSPRELSQIREDWSKKYVRDWTGDDVVSWIFDMAISSAVPEFGIPFYSFQSLDGFAIMQFKRNDFYAKLDTNTGIDHEIASRFSEILYVALQDRIRSEYLPTSEEAVVPTTLQDLDDTFQSTLYGSEGHLLATMAASRHSENSRPWHQHVPTSLANAPCDSGYDSLTEDSTLRFSENGSPQMLQEREIKYSECLSENELKYSDTLSESERNYNESLMDTTKVDKRKPGRPKGSGKKNTKRPKNVSVPEFLVELLLDPKYCPKIIKWEDYEIGKFRFVRTEEVAKLWGSHKRNNANKMSFEKFTRAMRYHYKKEVLVSVPAARLVYQFGPNAPPHDTDDPNFEKGLTRDEFCEIKKTGVPENDTFLNR